MKLLATIALATAATAASAAECYSSQMSFEELRYSTKDELVKEHCLVGKITKIYEPDDGASIPELRAYADRLGACADYYGQIAKVLRKEFNANPDDITCTK